MIPSPEHVAFRGFQAAYDYAWDRWGLYVGTYRLLLISILYVGQAIDVVVGALSNPGEYNLGIAAFFILGHTLVFFVFYASRHLLVDIPLQRIGSPAAFAQLNRTASGWQTKWATMFRIGLTLFIAAFLFRMFGFNLGNVGMLVGLLCWSFGNAVMVRPRNETRLVKENLVTQGT